jgi:hypothetical protein
VADEELRGGRDAALEGQGTSAEIVASAALSGSNMYYTIEHLVETMELGNWSPCPFLIWSPLSPALHHI